MGAPCASQGDICLEDGTKLECVDGRWELVDCTSRCADLEIPACVALAWGGAHCECISESMDPEPQPRYPPAPACVDAETLRTCRDFGDCQRYACTDICAAEGLTSVGCFGLAREPASCRCSSAETPCPAEAAPRCVGLDAVATCEDGAWAIRPCADCPAGLQPACRLTAEAMPGCTCEEAD